MSETIGIQGGPASYHEHAAGQLWPESTLTYFRTFEDLFTALNRREIDIALSALANNRVQYIPDPYEYLTAPDSQLRIVGETYVQVRHALLGLPGASLKDITEVHSQAPSLGQCEHFLEHILPHAHIVEETDTALSAKLVAEQQNANWAAIASEAAGALYGLEVLQAGVQDDKQNLTRFVAVRLAGDKAVVPDANKTTLMLTTPDSPGALVDALALFKEADINLTSLQSKIIPNSAFEMEFFVEFAAGSDDVKDLLRHLEANNYKLRVLGSYAAADIPL